MPRVGLEPTIPVTKRPKPTSQTALPPKPTTLQFNVTGMATFTTDFRRMQTNEKSFPQQNEVKYVVIQGVSKL
jgi:hypothetical protein